MSWERPVTNCRTGRRCGIEYVRTKKWIRSVNHVSSFPTSSVWFFMSTNLQKIPVKISWHSDLWSTSYRDLSDARLDILKTMDSKQFRVLIYHCVLMKETQCKLSNGLKSAYFETKNKSFYKKGIEMLEKRWTDCVAFLGITAARSVHK